MKQSTMLIILVLLIVAGGYFLLGNSGTKTTGNIVAGDNNDIQEVVIGMKNYNYYPNTVSVKAGSPVRITLDESVYGCFRDFTIRELGVRKYLKTSKDFVEFIPDKPGEYTFACSMGMGTGTFIVK